jgi:hypothetical protein
MRTNLELRRELAPAPCQLLGEDLLLSEEGQVTAHHVVQQHAQAPHCQLVRVIPANTASTFHIKTTLVISGLYFTGLGPTWIFLHILTASVAPKHSFFVRLVFFWLKTYPAPAAIVPSRPPQMILC